MSKKSAPRKNVPRKTNPHPSLIMTTPLIEVEPPTEDEPAIEEPMPSNGIKLILLGVFKAVGVVRSNQYVSGTTLIYFDPNVPPEELSQIFSDLDEAGSLYIEPRLGTKVYSKEHVEGHWKLTKNFAKNKVADSDSRAELECNDSNCPCPHCPNRR